MQSTRGAGGDLATLQRRRRGQSVALRHGRLTDSTLLAAVQARRGGWGGESDTQRQFQQAEG